MKLLPLLSNSLLLKTTGKADLFTNGFRHLPKTLAEQSPHNFSFVHGLPQYAENPPHVLLLRFELCCSNGGMRSNMAKQSKLGLLKHTPRNHPRSVRSILDLRRQPQLPGPLRASTPGHRYPLGRIVTRMACRTQNRN